MKPTIYYNTDHDEIITNNAIPLALVKIDKKTHKYKYYGFIKATRSIENAFPFIIGKITTSQLSNRLLSIMKKIAWEGRTKANKHFIYISQHKKYLQAFQFDTFSNLDKIIKTPFSVYHTSTRDKSILSVPAFSPLNSIIAPAGATHFRLINALGIISDFEYDPKTENYEPIDPDNNEKNVVAYSAFLSLNNFIADQSITATFDCFPSSNINISVIQCIGIEFYQQVGTNYYSFYSGNCMKVVKIF